MVPSRIRFRYATTGTPLLDFNCKLLLGSSGFPLDLNMCSLHVSWCRDQNTKPLFVPRARVEPFLRLPGRRSGELHGPCLPWNCRGEVLVSRQRGGALARPLERILRFPLPVELAGLCLRFSYA